MQDAPQRFRAAYPGGLQNILVRFSVFLTDPRSCGSRSRYFTGQRILFQNSGPTSPALHPRHPVCRCKIGQSHGLATSPSCKAMRPPVATKPDHVTRKTIQPTMKNLKPIQDHCSIPLRLVFAWVLYFALNTQLFSLLAQGTAFTYQGRLDDAGQPAHGIYDFRFTIYDSASGGYRLFSNSGATAGVYLAPGWRLLVQHVRSECQGKFRASGC